MDGRCGSRICVSGGGGAAQARFCRYCAAESRRQQKNGPQNLGSGPNPQGPLDSHLDPSLQSKISYLYLFIPFLPVIRKGGLQGDGSTFITEDSSQPTSKKPLITKDSSQPTSKKLLITEHNSQPRKNPSRCECNTPHSTFQDIKIPKFYKFSR